MAVDKICVIENIGDIDFFVPNVNIILFNFPTF
jgi:hypothetical protein